MTKVHKKLTPQSERQPRSKSSHKNEYEKEKLQRAISSTTSTTQVLTVRDCILNVKETRLLRS